LPPASSSAGGRASFAFRPGVGLEVAGTRDVVSHFAGEYGRAGGLEGEEPAVRVRFLARKAGRPAPSIVGGHKTVSWRVDLSNPEARPLEAHVALGGRPRSFALSLVQGYVVEPLVSVAAARAAHVLLPSAAVERHGHALVLLGRSRSGKSSVSARALAAGRRVLGDDQILVDRFGRCWAFPRRMRFYSDLQRTAPAAFARLRATERAALVGRGVVRQLTHGYVAPSMRVDATTLGPSPVGEPLPISRVILIERGAGVVDLEVEELAADAAIEAALELLDAQRIHLARGKEPGWNAALAETRELERSSLAAALSGRELERLRVPQSWDAPLTIRRLAEHLGIEP